MDDGTFPALLKTLSDSSEEVTVLLSVIPTLTIPLSLGYQT